MATTDYLAEPADLAVWLGVPADDPKLRQALAAASSRFRGAVRHPVTAVTGDVVTVDGTGRESVPLPAAPVTAVSEVRLDGALLAEAADFSWSSDGYLRRLGGQVWPDRLRCIQVTYSHGYEVVPEDIAEVVIDQARALYTVLPGVQTRQVGGQSVTFGVQAAIGVTAQWTAAVERYRLNAGDRP
ncbi:mobile element protein [Streptomyces leeuwenhoekii]|uniref:Mobile element protein n=1 Tax=Streptomyces leeuwenhoekii TaxID=1437453 RepID=A0ABR5HT93_STRLW|nr:mobile element protein [Streptomyces leeuwenhoekii]KMS71768.1 mobile element protein [Streptomyces leeuwenhoekii]